MKDGAEPSFLCPMKKSDRLRKNGFPQKLWPIVDKPVENVDKSPAGAGGYPQIVDNAVQKYVEG
jgi:hypothetical protein